MEEGHGGAVLVAAGDADCALGESARAGRDERACDVEETVENAPTRQPLGQLQPVGVTGACVGTLDVVGAL